MDLVRSTQQIQQANELQFAQDFNKMLKFVCIDLGYRPNQDEWGYISASLYKGVKKYYSHLTLQEIKTAFELAIVGKLDNYLPNGANDAKCYGSFNLQYMARILNAYQAYRNSQNERKQALLPPPTTEYTEADKERGRKWVENQIIQAYCEVKYKYGVNATRIGLSFVYRWLKRIGYAKDVTPNEYDEQRAFQQLKARIAKGFVNKHYAGYLTRNGGKSQEAQDIAQDIAQINEINRAFGEIINNDINILQLI